MTNDYKTKLLKWISGNYNVQIGSNVPQFTTPTSHNNNFKNLLNPFFPYGYSILTTFQGVNSSGNGVGNVLIVGNYDGLDGDTVGGFIAIYSSEFNGIDTILNYSTGTFFGNFEAFNVGEDGNFFGIENNYGTKRFIMLNNILAKLPTETRYKVVLRQSYIVPSSSKLTTASIAGIMKSSGNAKYCIFGNYYEDPNQKPLVTELTVNVGSTNTWTDYTYSESAEFYAKDCLPSWDSTGNLSLKLVGTENISGSYAFMQYSAASGTTSLTKTQIGSTLGAGNMDIKILTNNDIYGCFHEITASNEKYHIYKINMSNYSLTEFYTKITPLVSSSNQSGMKIVKNGQELFYYIQSNKDTTPTKYLYYFGKVIGLKAYEYYLGEFDPYLLTLFYVSKQFNLYIYYIQIDNTIYTMRQIYNSLNYNGVDYQALNSMIPNNVNLYDTNGIVIYARNLYNRIVNNNTTISTIEISNDYLNGFEIVLKELISQTNSIMVSDTATKIIKNIYEELLINFANTILIKNSNDLNNIIINNKAASRLNNSVSNPLALDYSNSKITKYKINYGNDTSVINPINTNLTYNGLSTNYIIRVYVPLEYGITSVQLLSDDELTVYQTIDCSNLENNKYYTLNQKMEVI